MDLGAKVLARFDAKVVPEPNTGCWLWTASADTGGYGQLRVNGKIEYTHRMAYVRHIGPIPDGLHVCHRCDTPACVNPSHLFVGTRGENMRDMMAKGRKVSATGDAHGSRTKPERVSRGADHYSRTRPERVARGDACGSRKYPERRPRGEAHGCAKLTSKDVGQLRFLHTEGWLLSELAREFDISKTHAKRVVAGISWGGLGGAN